MRERKEYYHNYVKKINKKSVYQYIYEHRKTAKQQIVQDLTMELSMHSGTLEHICIDPKAGVLLRSFIEEFLQSEFNF